MARSRGWAGAARAQGPSGNIRRPTDSPYRAPDQAVTLRLYQLRAVEQLLDAFRRHRQAAERAAAEARQQVTIQEFGGRLVELSAGKRIDAAQFRTMPLRKAMGLCRTLSDLQALGRARGYQPGWAWKVMQVRREGRGARR